MATPKPVRKAAKKFISSLKDAGSSKSEQKKEKKLAHSKVHFSGKDTVKDINKQTKEVKMRTKMGLHK